MILKLPNSPTSVFTGFWPPLQSLIHFTQKPLLLGLLRPTPLDTMGLVPTIPSIVPRVTLLAQSLSICWISAIILPSKTLHSNCISCYSVMIRSWLSIPLPALPVLFLITCLPLPPHQCNRLYLCSLTFLNPLLPLTQLVHCIRPSTDDGRRVWRMGEWYLQTEPRSDGSVAAWKVKIFSTSECKRRNGPTDNAFRDRPMQSQWDPSTDGCSGQGVVDKLPETKKKKNPYFLLFYYKPINKKSTT